MNHANVAVAIVALAVVAVVGHSLAVSMTAAADSAVEDCDAKYGDGQWVWVSANDSEWDPTYIGDQKVCVDAESDRATQ